MASCSPVLAPLGTAARPTMPSSRMTSPSTVGFPRLSRISRATMSAMIAGIFTRFEVAGIYANAPREPSDATTRRSASPWTLRGLLGDVGGVRLLVRADAVGVAQQQRHAAPDAGHELVPVIVVVSGGFHRREQMHVGSSPAESESALLRQRPRDVNIHSHHQRCTRAWRRQ